MNKILDIFKNQNEKPLKNLELSFKLRPLLLERIAALTEHIKQSHEVDLAKLTNRIPTNITPVELLCRALQYENIYSPLVKLNCVFALLYRVDMTPIPIIYDVYEY
jgi:hypothetical protein